MYKYCSPLLVALLSTGCATAPVEIDPSASYALNVARASGISAKLEDREVPADTVSSITDSGAYGAAMAASGYAAPVPGISSVGMAGLNVAAWLLAPQAKSARNSMFAWMPTDSVKGGTPEDSLADMLLDAAAKAVEDMGYTPVSEISHNGTDKSGVAVYLRDGDQKSCKNVGKVANCWVTFGVRDPVRMDSPPPVVNEKSAAWFFDPAANVFSFFKFPKENSGLNELEVLVRVSAYMPNWFYFYVAPNQIKVGKDQPLKIPMIVSQGKVHLFLKEAKPKNG